MRNTLVLVACALVLAACGDASEPTLAPSQTAVPTTAAPTTTTTAPAATTTTGPATGATTTTPTTTTLPPATTTTTTLPPTTTVPEGVVVIEVMVAGGEVDGEDRVEVTVGDEIVLTVTADVSDEVHVHGYDVFGDVTPDAPAVLEFVADIPGIFEVELEDSHLVLFGLVVEP